MKKVAVILCNDMHMDIAKANTLLSSIMQNEAYEVVCDYTIADIVIVITCAFGPHKMYSVRAIADVQINCKKDAEILVTGCLLKTIYDVLRAIPGITVISFEELLKKFKSLYEKKINVIPQNKVIISEGCLHKCSYCVYPQIFSGYKSKPIDEVLNEIKELYESESTIYITGAQETSDYGIDLYGKRRFDVLLEQIVTNYPNCNYVIGWFHPAGLTDDVISIIANNPNIIEIMLHIQHVDESILKSMNRTSFEDTNNKIQKLRNLRSDLLISTEVIVGFPGETEEKFNNLVEYLNRGYFSDIGVASYERVFGTKAALLPNQVPNFEKEKRMNFIKNNFSATIYPATENTFIIGEYLDAHKKLTSMPKNILKDRQKYNLIAGIDTDAKLDEFYTHLSDVLECVTNARTTFDFERNQKYVFEKYTSEARKFFLSIIQNGDFKDSIKQRAAKLLL